MLKKFLKLMMVFGILSGCYIGYVHAFDTLLARLATARKIDDVGFVVRDSKSKTEAIQRAVASFGPNHWAADKNLHLRYYNSDRGFWMYSQKEQRVIEENGVRYDGKRIKLRPVAFIWGAADGNSTKLVTADEATIEFNQSLSFNAKGSEPLVVKYAKLEGNVVIRDDRGTPDDPSDDMVIGPLTWVDYDDDKLMVRSDSDIVIVDRNTRITGEGGPGGGMEIQLRPKAQQSKQPAPRNAGFEGAQYAKLLKNVHIITSDVGKAGIIFGPGNETAKSPNGTEVAAAQGQGQGAAAAKAAPIPLDVKSDGPMQVDLPKPRLPVRVGPPLPPSPTLVHFTRNVVVRHGRLDELPKQLDCDNLDLTLVKSEKAPPVPREGDAAGMAQNGTPDEAVASTVTAEAEAAGSGESNNLLGGLTLQKVKATGHAVWLQMPGEGQKIRCNELLHRVASADGKEPGMTYFRGDATRKLMVEMIEFVNERPKGMEGPVEPKAVAITRVWTLDATLVDNGGGMNAANLFARGPGLMETRPIQPRAGARPDDPADRTVVWNDLFIMKNHMGPDKTIAQREMILKGQPSVVDRIQKSSLDSTDTIAIWLKPKPAEAISPIGPLPVAASDKPGPPDQKGGFQIQKLVAIGDVHMTSETRSLTARKKLEATFEELPRIKADPVSVASASPRPAPAAAQPATAAPAATTTSETPAAKPAEPAMIAQADRIEATILIDPNKTAKTDVKKEAPASGGSESGALFASSMGDSNSGYTIRDVRMFGGVHLHQDPPEGKVKGLDATGEVMVLRSEGPGKAIFNLYHEDPTLKTASTTATPADPASPRRPQARVITDDQTIKGNTIGMNQVTDEAWVYGAGELTQMTDRALLSDKAEPTDDATDSKKVKTRGGKELSKRVPIVFTWGDRMLFHGRSIDPDNRSSAKIEFFKNAKAEMEDAVLFCDQVMTAYTDKPIPLADMGKLSQTKKADAANAVEAGENAETVAAASKPDLTFLDLVGHAQVINRKVDPDRPVAISRQKLKGQRIMYDRRSGEFLIPGEGMVYLYDRGGKSSFGVGPESDRTANGGKIVRPTSGKAETKPGAKNNLDDLVLTQIKFTEGMKGRFGTGKSTDKTETRWAEFFGANEVARAVVPDEVATIKYDRPPPDTYFLTARTIRVVTEPPPPGSPANAPGRNFLKAWENAHARTKDVSVQADVITYDSHNDLIYAHGEEGRKVQVVQQAGTGQQTSHTPAEAFRINPKTSAVDVIGPQAVQLLDTRTGTRATHVAPPDRNAKPVKPPKRLYNPPPNSIERRGFKGG